MKFCDLEQSWKFFCSYRQFQTFRLSNLSKQLFAVRCMWVGMWLQKQMRKDTNSEMCVFYQTGASVPAKHSEFPWFFAIRTHEKSDVFWKLESLKVPKMASFP
jgi:hypothetical protein